MRFDGISLGDSWRDAKERNLPRYRAKKPCKHGHPPFRYVAGRLCVECRRLLAKRDKSIARTKKWYADHTHRQKLLLWARYRQTQKKYPGVYDLTEDAIEWPSECPILGIPMKYETQRNKNADDAPTIDRIDPSKGYVMGNVQVISRRANRIKNDGTPDEVMRVALFMNRGKEK